LPAGSAAPNPLLRLLASESGRGGGCLDQTLEQHTPSGWYNVTHCCVLLLHPDIAYNNPMIRDFTPNGERLDCLKISGYPNLVNPQHWHVIDNSIANPSSLRSESIVESVGKQGENLITLRSVEISCNDKWARIILLRHNLPHLSELPFPHIPLTCPTFRIPQIYARTIWPQPQ